MSKDIEMQVLGASGYETIHPVPAVHASSHATGGSDAITPASIGAYTKTETESLINTAIQNAITIAIGGSY